MARPTLKTDELCAVIGEGLMRGKSLREICGAEDMPVRGTVFRWLAEDQNFAAEYARAKMIGLEIMGEDLLEIADDGRNDTYTDDQGNERIDHDVIARSKLRVDTRKWLLSKLLPKKYGDKIDVGIEGQTDQHVIVTIGGNPAKELEDA